MRTYIGLYQGGKADIHIAFGALRLRRTDYYRIS